MKLKKWITLIVAAAMALSLTGCLGNMYENALTVDGTDISSGLYLMAQFSAYSEADSKKEDAEKDVLKQEIEGVKAADWIKQRTEELLKRYVAVHRMARERDITLSTQGQQSVQQMMQLWSYPEYAEIYAENGIAEDTARRYYTNQALGDQLFEALYDESGEKAVNDEELKKEYSAQNGHIRYLSVPVSPAAEDGNDYSQQVYDMLAAMVKRLEEDSSLDLETVAKEDFPAVYTLLGREFDPNTIDSAVTTGYIPYEDESSPYSEEFRKQLQGQKVGDYGTAPVSTSAILYQVIPTFEDDSEFDDMRATVLADLKRDEFEAYLQEAYQDYAVSYLPLAQWYFRPSKIS